MAYIEFFFILVLAFIIIGPKDFPKFMGFLGRIVHCAKDYAGHFYAMLGDNNDAIAFGNNAHKNTPAENKKMEKAEHASSPKGCKKLPRYKSAPSQKKSSTPDIIHRDDGQKKDNEIN